MRVRGGLAGWTLCGVEWSAVQLVGSKGLFAHLKWAQRRRQLHEPSRLWLCGGETAGGGWSWPRLGSLPPSSCLQGCLVALRVVEELGRYCKGTRYKVRSTRKAFLTHILVDILLDNFFKIKWLTAGMRVLSTPGMHIWNTTWFVIGPTKHTEIDMDSIVSVCIVL